MGLHETEVSACQKKPEPKLKDTQLMGETHYSLNASDNEAVSKRDKDFTRYMAKKIQVPSQKWGEKMDRCFSE